MGVALSVLSTTRAGLCRRLTHPAGSPPAGQPLASALMSIVLARHLELAFGTDRDHDGMVSHLPRSRLGLGQVGVQTLGGMTFRLINTEENEQGLSITSIIGMISICACRFGSSKAIIGGLSGNRGRMSLPRS